MTKAQMETPLWISPYDQHKWKLEPHDISYDDPNKVCNPNTAQRDIIMLRNAQIELARRGMLNHYVRGKYITQITGEHFYYVRMALWRLARAGMVERYRKPARHVKGRWDVYYLLKNLGRL